MSPAARAGEVLGAIDLGSSAVRLTLARVEGGGALRPIFQHRVPVRLGSAVFAGAGHGEIGEDVQRELVGALQLLRDFCARHHAGRVRAVATSAMREAANAPAICRRVAEEVGLTLEILDGAQEGALARQALSAALARQNCPVPAEARLYVDLGGGSLEVEDGAGRLRTSLPLGTVRLLARLPALRGPVRAGIDGIAAVQGGAAPFAGTGAATGPQLARLRAEVDAVVVESFAPYAAVLRAPPAQGWTLIGTGGNLEAMANLLPLAGHATGRQVQLEGLWPLAQKIAPLTLAQRSERYGLRPDRADLLLPALMVTDALVRTTHARGLWVPGSGLRDGLLAALARGD